MTRQALGHPDRFERRRVPSAGSICVPNIVAQQGMSRRLMGNLRVLMIEPLTAVSDTGLQGRNGVWVAQVKNKSR
jgi:hypothetical protein